VQLYHYVLVLTQTYTYITIAKPSESIQSRRMATKLHRRTPSNDGTLDTIISRNSSNSSNLTMETNDNNHNNSKDIESFQPLLPTRGRSSNNPMTGKVELNHINNHDDNNNNKGESSALSPSTSSSTVKISGSAWKAISACLNYSFCSVSMILVNKSLASR
jgi:hypothetical protein